MGKPEIRFKGYTDEWEQRKLGDLVDRVTRKNQDLVSELPLTISAQYGLIDQNEFFDKRVASKDVSGYYLIENGEFAYNKSTSTDAPWGAIKRLDRYENGVLSTLYIVFGIKENNPVDSDFLVSYYSTNLWHKGIHEIAAEGARNHGLLNIAPADFFETKLMIPQDIEEQKKIGKYFEELERLITLHQRKCAEIKSLKKYMLQKMFPQNEQKVPEIRFEGFTEAWEQRKLKDIIEYIVDNRGKNPPYYCSEGIPVIDNFMIQNTLYPDLQTATRFIDSALYNDFIRKYNEEDDTLLTLVGNGIGNITLFPKEKAVIIQNTLGFRAKKNRKFLFFLLMANNEKLLKLDRGMAQPSIRQDEILDIDIHVPSESEQTEIGKYFTSIDNLITLHQQKCEELKKIKKFMLQKMFV